MSQIDVLLGYSSEAAAAADPVLAPYVTITTVNNVPTYQWDASHVFNNMGAGLQIWNTTQDTTTTQTGPNGQSYQVTTHTYQPGYALIVSYTDPTIAPGQVNPNAASLAPWKADAACVLIADRDAANANNPGFLYYSTLTNAQMDPMRLQPGPAGSNYPFGSP